ncbi:integrase [Streptomyces hirsutus]|uniref:integrase n=1 Tax=Streptomyces hirsutus TaxID=35620 RepID=UPI0036A48E21
MADPACGRHRPGPAPLRPDLAGVPDGPGRGIVAVDFLHVDTALGGRLYAPAFLEHGTRRLPITGVTARPPRAWAVRQARNLAADPGRRTDSLRFPPRDRDDTYGAAFDAVFGAEGLEVILSAPRAPRVNAHCEQVIGSIRREALDHVLIIGEAHAGRCWPAIRTTTTGIGRTGHANSSHPTPTAGPPPSTTSTTEDSCVPESSAASSTSTDTLPDVQR